MNRREFIKSTINTGMAILAIAIGVKLANEKTIGIKRGSPRMLDNWGVVVKIPQRKPGIINVSNAYKAWTQNAGRPPLVDVEKQMAILDYVLGDYND